VKADFCIEIGLNSTVETAAVRAKAGEIGALLDSAGVVASVEAVHCSHRSDNSPAIRIVAATQDQLGAAIEAITSGWMIPPDWARQGKFPFSFSLQVEPSAEQ